MINTQVGTQKQDQYYLSLTTPLAADTLVLQNFHGEERVSELFEFSLDMTAASKDIDFTQVVGKSATITMILRDGTKRYINGLMGRFSVVDTNVGGVVTRYRTSLHPWLWMLTLTSDCLIFQNQTAMDIIKAVFDAQGFTDYRDDTTKTYETREYCVQYRETAFNFVSRLMEQEGVFYFFEHTASKHTLVMADDASGHADCASFATVTYRPGEALRFEDDVLSDIQYEEQVVTGGYAVNDYNFETPATSLLTTADGAGSTMKMYDYAVTHQKKDRGDSLAKVRIESLEMAAKILRGQGGARGFVPGFKFTMSAHPRSALNASYVLTSVRHEASPESYRNFFEAIPAATPFRHRQLTPKPMIHGTQTAQVVGKSGEEIWTDKYGRIKVQFHWDRVGKKDENSSCWIRVAQNWAGKTFGFWFLPRIGQEVVVSFLEGDPDRPLVTGSVYNATVTLPYPLPDEQTKSTIKTYSSKSGTAGNELRFEDKKDSEEVYIHAQKDMNTLVENDQTWTIKHDQTSTIKNHRSVTIEEGNDTLKISKGNRSLEVTKGNDTYEVKEGNRTLTVAKGNETRSVKGNFTETVDGNYELTVKGNFTLTVTGDVTIEGKKTMLIKSGTTMTTKSGTTFDSQSGTAYTIKSGTAMTIKSGTGLDIGSGISLNVKAGASLAMQATATMDIKSNAPLTLKSSAMGTVDGGGMLTVKGGLVKIN